VNKALSSYDFDDLKATIEDIYDSPVAAMIPLSEDVAGMQSSDIFSLRYPDHQVSKEIKKIAAVIRGME
jgi:MinD-like ATPase involved in chromosome partitioning or flagellar assembly